MAQEIVIPSSNPTINMPYLTPQSVGANRAAMEARLAALEQQFAPQAQLLSGTQALPAGQPALAAGQPALAAAQPAIASNLGMGSLQAQLAPTTPLALSAGTPALTAGSATTQAGAVNAARAASSAPPLTAAELNGDVAALRGVSGGTGTSGGGLLAQLRGGLASEAGLGGYLGGGAMGALKTLGARAGAGTLYALAPTALGMGVEAFGKPIEHALGLAPGSTKGTAQAGADVGTGALLGTLVAPGPGTLIGAALGGAKDIVPLAGELVGDIAGSGVAQEWGKATGQFNKIITKTGQSNVGKKGVQYLNQNYLPAGQEIMRQAKAGEITHDAAVAGMNKLNTMMQADIVKLRSAHTDAKSGSKKRTAVQIQMGEAMAQLAQRSVESGNAARDTLNNLAMDPNMAAIAPVLQASAQQRATSGQQMADAYTGAAYLDIPEQRLDAKLKQQQQLLQQIYAAQNANPGSSGGGGSSLADLAAQVK